MKKAARPLSWAGMLLALAVLLGDAPPPQRQSVGQRNPPIVWFTPGPGTLDMLRLFEAPEEWATARSRVAVFKFYQAQLLEPPDPKFLPNSYAALRTADAFRTLSRVWGKRIAIEVGAVKEFNCAGGVAGMNDAVRKTLQAVAAVRAGGGEVSYLAMDGPFTATRLHAHCGGEDVSGTLRSLERYVRSVRLVARGVQVGLIEQFPISSPDEIVGYIRQMAARGIRPAFFHLDADLNGLPRGSDRFEREIPAMLAAIEAEGVPVGMIFFGHSGESDSDYYNDALDLARRTSEALPDLPRDLIFQSWAESKSGRRITPANLPETGRHTHTALINAGLEALRR